ncbi:MAG: transglycosylase domain-containing protein [Oligoflexales bacterium]|nr:transglycosylase domain-containing protein [Oligoflexales bacterium]
MFSIAAIILFTWWVTAMKIANDHVSHRVSHRGWSFPVRVFSDSVGTEVFSEKLAVEAKARGYRENCTDMKKGEYCEKNGRIIPRSGNRLEPLVIGWIFGEDSEIREHLPLEEAPKYLIDAIVASEDREFWNHHGVNLVSLFRALRSNIENDRYSQGASTLTMQVVRNFTESREKTIYRKIREVVMAVATDFYLGKKGVLQAYLDVPYLGQNGGLAVCGFRAASRHYFGKDVSELTLGEASMLAAILPSPGKYGPDRSRELAIQKRNQVLAAMKKQFGYDIEDAMKEPLKIVPPVALPERFPSYLSAVRIWLTQNIDKSILYGAGLNVTTAMNLADQTITENIMREKTAKLENMIGRRKEPLESASILMDVNTGHVRALWGGMEMKSTQFNRAVQSRRQPGSAFKPLVYALAFSQPPRSDGKPRYTASNAESNTIRKFGSEAGEWSPRNVEGRYSDTASLAYGLALSQNIATASLLEELGGPKPLIDFAEKLGFDVSRYPDELGISLGQAEAAPMELAQFSATVANGGTLVKGTLIVRIVDAAGKTVYLQPEKRERVLSPEAATLTRELMRLVVDWGTGGAVRGAGGEGGYSGEVMGKTGTSDHERDLWFVGATPELAAVVWLGYDTPKSLAAAASDLAAPLWGWWMHSLTKHESKLPKFSNPVEIEHKMICRYTGKIAGPGCKGINAPFLKGTGPAEVCSEEHYDDREEYVDAQSDVEDEALEEQPIKKTRKYESIWKRLERAEGGSVR